MLRRKRGIAITIVLRLLFNSKFILHYIRPQRIDCTLYSKEFRFPCVQGVRSANCDDARLAHTVALKLSVRPTCVALCWYPLENTVNLLRL